MYEEYWKLRSRPFRNTVDPAFFYRSAQHEEALMKLTYAVTENMGSAMLTGAYGCGKTLLAAVLFRELGGQHRAVICNAQPEMTPLDLLRAMARTLGGAPLPAARSEMMADALMEIVEKALKENARDGKKTVVGFDEAHLINNLAVLETTRLLMNFHSADGFLLTLILIGHPELAERVAGVKQLAQRIPVTCSLKPFDRPDTLKYVRSRLRVSGGSDQLFGEDALDLIHRQSGGIPRRINTLCEVSLMAGFAKKVQRIDANLVGEAAERFGAT